MPVRIRRFAALLVLFALSLSVRPAPAADGDGVEDIDLPVLADAFRKHCVKVYVQAKTHNGAPPSTGDFADDIRNERPSLFGGYWWDERHVIVPDPVIGDDFVGSVEIGVPFNDRRYPARIAGHFLHTEALLLEALPDENGALPRAAPLALVDGDIGKSVILGYEWDRGDWRVKAHAAIGAAGITDSGLETLDIGSTGLFVAPDGRILGLAFGKRLGLGALKQHWQGETAARSPFLDAKRRDERARAMREVLRRAVLETKFRLRVKIDDDDEEEAVWSFEPDGGVSRAPEIVAAGFVTGPRHLLVPVGLNAEAIARIEEIAIVLGNGRETRGRFVGACREYLAVVVEAEDELPAGDLPEGFAMLNPLVLPNEAFDPDTTVTAAPVFEYLDRWHIDYALGGRRETHDYDRWLGTFRGYRGDTVVMTHTNEADGSLGFDVDGKLRAVALTPRLLPTRNEPLSSGRTIKATPGFRPIGSLHRRLQKPDVFDPALAPVDEEDGKRLVDLGVEYQALDKNTARLFFAERQTRGGDIGMLVTHVYEGSEADRLGLREHDILLRIFIEGRSEPIELKALKGEGPETFFNLEDASAESLAQFMSAMPPPWPPRDNSLTTILTGAGVGKRAALEYVREGETLRAEFVTGYFAPDYRNAVKSRFDKLGLTVKPVTYEVARFFRRPDSAGVIVSRVEPGGRSAVAGLAQYLLITHVDGSKVERVEDFRDKVARFETGETAAVELTVEGFGKTRLVKIEESF